MTNPREIQHKVVFLGDSSTGKTSIIFKYLKLAQQPFPTIAASSFPITVPLSDSSVNLSCWDTAGQESYRCLVRMYARDAKVACPVFDQANPTKLILTTFVLGVNSPSERHRKVHSVSSNEEISILHPQVTIMGLHHLKKPDESQKISLSGRTSIVAMRNQELAETAMTGIQMEKERLVIVFQFYEANFDNICLVGGEKTNRANLQFAWIANSILGIHNGRQFNALISRSVGALYPADICIFNFNSFLTIGSRITPILFLGLGM
jgi:GTPase SAR1 family protein